MSTTVETNKVTFTGNGSTVDFAFTFRVFADTDLEVYLDGVLKTLTTHYTVSIDPSVEGGTVTFVTAPASSVAVLIKRVLDYTQPSDIPTESNFPEATIENALDRATMLIVQLKEILSRVPQLAITSAFSDLILPEPSAGKVLGWSDAADALENLTLQQTTVAYSGTISKGVDASKPASPSQGDIYFATDTNVLYKCITGGSWNAVTERVKGASVASATTTNIWSTDGDMIHVTGTTTITGLGTALKAGAERIVVFDGALTLTHHATNLILPGGANITTAAGDIMVVRAETTTTFRVISYVKASGLPVVASSADMAYANTRFVVGSTTRDISLTTVQSITGLGFQPKALMIFAVVDGTTNSSWGYSDGTTNRCIHESGAGSFSTDAYVAKMRVNGTPDQAQAAASFTADGFDLTWSKNNAPTGTATLTYIAFR